MTVLHGIIPDPCPKCGGSGMLGLSADQGGIFNEECYYCDGTGNDPEDQNDLVSRGLTELYPDE